jgi:hypothetical protein
LINNSNLEIKINNQVKQKANFE